MKLAKIAYFLCAAGIAVNVAAEGALHTEPATDNADLKGIIRNLLQDNASFVGSHKSNYYKYYVFFHIFVLYFLTYDYNRLYCLRAIIKIVGIAHPIYQFLIVGSGNR